MASMDVVVEQSDNHINEEENGEQSEYNEVSAIASNSILHKKFPLKYKWGFYFLSNEKNLEWMERLSRICDLSSVEEFWTFIDRIRPPSVMSQCDYSLFKNNIQPVWEEKENKNGGRIVYQLARQDQCLLNEMWLKLMLGMIGGFFGDVTESICGAVCSSRQKGSKISIWTTNADDEAANKEIGSKIKAIWAPHSAKGSDILLHYECHSDAQNKQSSVVPRKFTM